MARTEGRNQPDLLSILHKREGSSAPVSAPVAAPSRTPAASAPLSRSSHPILAGGPPSRLTGSRPRLSKEVVILGLLGLVVVGLTVALIWHAYHKPVLPAAGTPAAAAHPGTTPPVKATTPPAKASTTPSGAWTPALVGPASGKGAKTYWTLFLCSYKLDQEAAARKACQQLRARGKDCADVFLYRGKDRLEVCLGHFDADRNIMNNPKVTALHKQLSREYPGMLTVQRTIAQPQ